MFAGAVTVVVVVVAAVVVAAAVVPVVVVVVDVDADPIATEVANPAPTAKASPNA